MSEKPMSEAEKLADAVLRAAGSRLGYYTVELNRKAIIAAAQKGIDDVKARVLSGDVE